MKLVITYVWLHVAAAFLWWWLIAPRTTGRTIVTAVLVLGAVLLFWRVVLPRYRRNSWDYEDRTPELIVHTVDRDWKQPERKWKPERTAEERNTIADIHGTG